MSAASDDRRPMRMEFAQPLPAIPSSPSAYQVLEVIAHAATFGLLTVCHMHGAQIAAARKDRATAKHRCEMGLNTDAARRECLEILK